MTPNQIAYLQTLPTEKRSAIMMNYESNKRETSTAYLFLIFLGGVGAHHFYMKRTVAGVLSLIFFWTFIPALIAFVELFFMAAEVRSHNSEAFRKAAQMFGADPPA